ncbi:CRISPR-associated protein Cas4 [Methanococcus sp. CF]
MPIQDKFKDLRLKGTEINYYFICKTKLYLFSKNIRLENEHENVRLGKFLHEKSYNHEKKDIIINSIAIDYIKNKDGILEIHEVKKTDKMEKSDIFQVLYYIYYLKNQNIPAIGFINYPSKNKILKVELNNKNTSELEQIIEKIHKIIDSDVPVKPEKKTYCKKCAYFEFCFS